MLEGGATWFKNARGKSISYAILFSMLARLIGMLSTIILTPLIINRVGIKEFGVWSIMIQFVGYLGFLDLGLGNGLLNVLNSDKGDDSKFAQKAINTSFYFLIGTTIISGFLMYFAFANDVWIEWIFNVSPELLELCKKGIFILLVCMLINLPYSVVQKVQFAYLNNYYFHISELVQKTFSVLSVMIGIYFNATLPVLVLLFFMPIAIVNIANFHWYLLVVKKISLYRLSDFSKSVFHNIGSVGFGFLLLSILYLFSRSLDSVIIANTLGIEYVSEYEVSLRPVMIVSTITTMIGSTLWPAFGDAIKKKDYTWAKRVFIRAFFFSSAITLASMFPFFLFGNDIISLWVSNNSFFLDNSRFVYLAFYTVLLCGINIATSYLHADSRIKFQILLYALFLIISIPIKVYCAWKHQDLDYFIIVNCICLFLLLYIPVVFKAVNLIVTNGKNYS